MSANLAFVLLPSSSLVAHQERFNLRFGSSASTTCLLFSAYLNTIAPLNISEKPQQMTIRTYI